MTMIDFDRIAVLDTETTGLRHVSDGGAARVIQYGLIVVDATTLRYVTHRETFVNLGDDYDWFAPGVQEAMAINRIPRAILQLGGSPREALGEALDIDWRGTCLAAWGLDFDLKMVEGEHQLLGISGLPWSYRTLDIRSMCAGEQVRTGARAGDPFQYLGCGEWIERTLPTRTRRRFSYRDLHGLMAGRREHDAIFDAAQTVWAMRLHCESVQ